jgi:ankyrin repeat protein
MARLEDMAGQRYASLDLNQRDFYDNTLLFYYITSCRFVTVEGLKTLVANGADITVQNSSGASFMHCFVLHWHQCEPPEVRPVIPETAVVYNKTIDLLEFLAAKDFPFSHRNEHGQTVAHLLFKQIHLNYAGTRAPSIQQLDRILTALNTDIDALDNQGRCIGQYLDLMDRSSWTGESREHYEALVAKMSRASSLNSGNLMLDFKKLCSSAQSRGQSWSDVVETLGHSYLIDAKGDSPLVAMLKVWDESRDNKERYRCTEKLLQLGTEIDLKDRRGNTALVIAARRGFRTTDEQLLQSGANPNTVNY